MLVFMKKKKEAKQVKNVVVVTTICDKSLNENMGKRER